MKLTLQTALCTIRRHKTRRDAHCPKLIRPGQNPLTVRPPSSRSCRRRPGRMSDARQRWLQTLNFKYMRLKDKLRNLSAVVSLLMSTASAYGTSITVQISGTQILVVADTHEQLISPGTQTSNDDFCKIVPLGHAASAFKSKTPFGV